MHTLLVTVKSDSSQTPARKNREVVFERSSIDLRTGRRDHLSRLPVGNFSNLREGG